MELVQRVERIGWLVFVVHAVSACGGPPPSEHPSRVHLDSSPPDVGPEGPGGQTCALEEEARVALTWLAGPDGIAVSNSNPKFSFVLPNADFEPAREERPLMLSALRDDERTVSHPHIDNFSRSFLVARIAKLEQPGRSSMEGYVRTIEKELEGGARREFGQDSSLGPWTRTVALESEQPHVESNAVFDERLHVTVRAWPVGAQAPECALIVVLIGASISPTEIPSVVDSFGFL